METAIAGEHRMAVVLAAKLNGQKWPEQMDLRRKKKRPGVGLWKMSGVK